MNKMIAIVALVLTMGFGSASAEPSDDLTKMCIKMTEL